jgi:hypothetical protein
MIDTTITACIRPEILERTLSSFSSNLRNFSFKESTCYINVDPLPEKEDPQLVIDVAKKYFKEVVANTPQNPNFGMAVKWVWERVQSPTFLHLEDDWHLNSLVDANILIDALSKKNGISGISLKKRCLTSVCKIFICPSFIRTEWAKATIASIGQGDNPEFFVRSKSCGRTKWLFYPFNHNSPPIIDDIGREWMIKDGRYSKKGDFFKGWTKK